MKQQHKCRFCGKVLTVEVADDYAHDVFNLAKLLSCNPCADYQEEWHRLRRAIHAIAVRLAQGMIASNEGRDRAYEAIERLVKSYVRLLADRRGLPIPEHDPQIVDIIMAKPTLYAEVLKGIPAMFQQKALI